MLKLPETSPSSPAGAAPKTRVKARSDLQKARPGGRGCRTLPELRLVEGTTARAANNPGGVHGPHDGLPPLGSAPAGWSKPLKAQWRFVKARVPWLRESDRSLVITWCRFRVEAEDAYARLKADDDDGYVKDKSGALVDGPNWKRWKACEEMLARLEKSMGMSPVSRSRVPTLPSGS